MNTDTIRARKGQGLWGDTITALCDEVDRLTDLTGQQDADATVAAVEAADRIATLTAERDELAAATEALAEANADLMADALDDTKEDAA